jgi:hypothetical protein
VLDLLTKEQDYAFARPSLVRAKLRGLELAAGAASKRGQRGSTGTYVSPQARAREHAAAQQIEDAYRRMMADWTATGRRGAGATTGARNS